MFIYICSVYEPMSRYEEQSPQDTWVKPKSSSKTSLLNLKSELKSRSKCEWNIQLKPWLDSTTEEQVVKWKSTYQCAESTEQTRRNLSIKWAGRGSWVIFLNQTVGSCNSWNWCPRIKGRACNAHLCSSSCTQQNLLLPAFPIFIHSISIYLVIKVT